MQIAGSKEIANVDIRDKFNRGIKIKKGELQSHGDRKIELN